MRDLQPVTVVTITCAAVFGMLLALLGSLKVALAKRVNLGEGRVGTLLTTLNLAVMPLMILSGVLVDLWSLTGAIIVGSLATALALFGLAVRPSYRGAFAAVFLAGLGSACLATASIVLMPDAFFGPRQTTAAFCLGASFFALGALLAPPLAGLLLGKLAWRKTLGLLAVLCLVPGLVAAIFGQQLANLQTESGSLAELLTSPVVWMSGLVFFCYAPLEGGVSAWITAYLDDPAEKNQSRRWLLAGFWTAFVLSRLVVALAQQSGAVSANWDRPLLFIPPLLAAVVLGNLSGAVKPTLIAGGTMLLGFLLGPVFPTLLSLFFQTLRDEGVHANGAAYGIIFALASLGSLVIAPTLGAAVRQHDVQRALRIPTFVCLLLAAVTVVFCLLM